jgi:pSer/pThr/pTyr-binding forkhead associated (FHA) protein
MSRNEWLVGINVVAVAGNLPFLLTTGEFVVGRANHAQVVVAEPTVSRQHARIACGPDSLSIEDLGVPS